MYEIYISSRLNTVVNFVVYNNINNINVNYAVRYRYGRRAIISR